MRYKLIRTALIVGIMLMLFVVLLGILVGVYALA